MKKLALFSLGAVMAMSTSSAFAGDVPEGYSKTDETKSCVSLRSVDTIRPAGEKQLVVKMKNKDVYLSKTKGSCDAAGKFSNFIETRSSSNQLCKGEIVRVRDNNIGATAGTCTLGEFVKLEKKEA